MGIRNPGIFYYQKEIRKEEDANRYIDLFRKAYRKNPGLAFYCLEWSNKGRPKVLAIRAKDPVIKVIYSIRISRER
jgi:hypothetical protein